MKKTILNMKKSLQEKCYISFVSANDNFSFSVRKDDDLNFLDEKTVIVRRKSGRTTLINLELIVGICILEDWM